MGPLVFHHLGRMSRGIIEHGIQHYQNSLSCRHIWLKGGHLGLISMQGVYVEALIVIGMSNMTKSFTV
jgi:hypothetical protein